MKKYLVQLQLKYREELVSKPNLVGEKIVGADKQYRYFNDKLKDHCIGDVLIYGDRTAIIFAEDDNGLSATMADCRNMDNYDTFEPFSMLFFDKTVWPCYHSNNHTIALIKEQI